jgi:hypothetical protein
MDLVAELARAGITAGVALFASFFGAKWAESRRLQARFEKIDQIREEMRQVTRIQEDIKRQLQGGEWNRQALWKQRLESYTELLRVTTDYLERCHAVRLLADGASGGDVELHRVRTDMYKALSVVEIFGNAKVLATLKHFFARMGSAETLSGEIEAIRELQTSFVVAAREQLKGELEN